MMSVWGQRADDWGNTSRGDERKSGLQRFALGGAWHQGCRTVDGAPFLNVRSALTLCADAARNCNSLDDASTSRPEPNALLALNRMPRHAMLPECIAMCACHTFLRCFVDACFVMPISADYAGGAARCHAARGPTLRPQPRIRGGSSRDCKRGRGGMGGVVPKRCQFCLLHVVCSTCVGRPLQASRVSL